MRRRAVPVLAVLICIYGTGARSQSEAAPVVSAGPVLDQNGWPVVSDADSTQMIANLKSSALVLDYLKNIVEPLSALREIFSPRALTDITANIFGSVLNDKMVDDAIANPVRDLTAVTDAIRPYIALAERGHVFDLNPPKTAAAPSRRKYIYVKPPQYIHRSYNFQSLY